MRIPALLVAVTAIASGQTGSEILKKTGQTYRSLESYRFEAQVVVESLSEDSDTRTRSTKISAAILPDRRRLETKSGKNRSLRVFDGKTVWDFRAPANQVSSQSQATYNSPAMNTTI